MKEESCSKSQESEKLSSEEAQKLKFAESLRYPKERSEFYRFILKELKKRRNYIKNGLTFLVPWQLKKWRDDMETTADKIREKWPQSAAVIDSAREKIEDLLKEAEKENKRKKKGS